MYIPSKLIIKNIMSYEHLDYSFKNGEAIIIVGDNKDDPGQRGNGSGKSVLAEGIALAVTGSTIRDIKTKEVVRDGCEYGEVEWHLHNAMYRCELIIKRKIYAENKSSEYALFVDGKESSDSYSDFNTFNAHVFNVLGISKEDFFDFYLITKEYYKPFLKVGDTDKKKIINRFSGAYKVDGAIPHIEADVLEADKKIRAIDAQINTVKGKQEVVADYIRQHEEESNQEFIDEELRAVEEEIALLEKSDLEIQEKIIPITLEVELMEARLIEVEKMEEEERVESQDATEAMNHVRVQQGEVDRKSKDLRKRHKETCDMQADIEKQLAGIIECPKCSYKFTLADEEFDLQDAEDALKELKKIYDLQIAEGYELDEEDKKLSELQVEIQQASTEIRIRSKATQDRKRDLSRRATELKKEITLIQSQVDSNRKKIRALKESNSVVVDPNKGEQLANQLLTYIDEETEWRQKLQVAMDDKAAIEKWIVNFKNFKSYLANKSIANIQDYTNMYLQSMQTNISIKIDGYRMLANKKMKEEITVSVMRDGYDAKSYGRFSSGERGRIDVAAILAIQSLININSSSGGINLLILDEVLDSVDSLGLECIVGSLQSVNRTIMIVSQQEINALNNHTLTVRKENGKSKLL